VLALALCGTASLLTAADEKTAAPKADADGFVTIFDGKSMDGWKPNENPQSFKLEDGKLIVKGERAHLFYVGPVANHDFKNFHLRVECLTKPKANSGIYFHTKFQPDGWPAQGFEVQVNQTQSDNKKTGGLYAVKDVLNQSPVKDDEWYTYDIIVKDKHVVIKVNDKVTTDWTQPDDWTPPRGMDGRKIGSGTFALQAHDPGSEAQFRSIKVKVLD
jgi:hypothetical protein